MSNEIEKFLTLSDVAETALLTFYCHAIESQSPQPLINDAKAVAISQKLNPLLAKSPSKLLRNLSQGKLRDELVVHITLRAKRYDEYALAFLKAHPDGVIVNLACGLDSRFERIDNGKLVFYDLDLPEMIAFKRQFYKETERYHMLSSDVLDHAWMEKVTQAGKRPVLFLAEGLFMYLQPQAVKELVLALQKHFPGSELVCEVVTAMFARKPWNVLTSLKMQRQLKLGKGAIFTFGVRNHLEMASWHQGIQFLDDWSYFDTKHPRLGWVGTLGKIKILRTVQYTLHYKLNPAN